MTNQSILFKIALSYFSPGYFSAHHGYAYFFALRILVLFFICVATNQSILFKIALSVFSPCYFSAPHGYAYFFNSYPVTPLIRTAFKKSYLSPNYRLNRLPPVPLSSQAETYLFIRLLSNKLILYKNALFYCPTGYFSASGYVHLYNPYPDPRLNYTNYIYLLASSVYCKSVYVSATHIRAKKAIRYKNALCYCTNVYFSASHGYG